MHARGLLDGEFLTVAHSDSADDPARQPTELSLRAVNEREFVRGLSDRVEHRWSGTGVGGPHHRVNDCFGVFNQVKRRPVRLDMLAGDLDEMGGEKLAEPLHDRGEGLMGQLGDRIEQVDGIGVGIDARRQVFLMARGHGRPQLRPRRGPGSSRVGKLLDVKKDQTVHRCTRDREPVPRQSLETQGSRSLKASKRHGVLPGRQVRSR